MPIYKAQGILKPECTVVHEDFKILQQRSRWVSFRSNTNYQNHWALILFFYLYRQNLRGSIGETPNLRYFFHQPQPHAVQTAGILQYKVERVRPVENAPIGPIILYFPWAFSSAWGKKHKPGLSFRFRQPEILCAENS